MKKKMKIEKRIITQLKKKIEIEQYLKTLIYIIEEFFQKDNASVKLINDEITIDTENEKLKINICENGAFYTREYKNTKIKCDYYKIDNGYIIKKKYENYSKCDIGEEILNDKTEKTIVKVYDNNKREVISRKSEKLENYIQNKTTGKKILCMPDPVENYRVDVYDYRINNEYIIRRKKIAYTHPEGDYLYTKLENSDNYYLKQDGIDSNYLSNNGTYCEINKKDFFKYMNVSKEKEYRKRK